MRAWAVRKVMEQITRRNLTSTFSAFFKTYLQFKKYMDKKSRLKKIQYFKIFLTKLGLMILVKGPFFYPTCLCVFG